ncbi:glutathione S-transferase [Sedimentitalea sp. HM32M-2]|uniref:glutathione S-transferase n=1 Tax=Sedimentitalea sp. HM32M-2 TaxID=3351566 RepID=UPI00363C1761
MTYDLFIGDRMYSSWSLRGWLMFEKFGIPCRTHMIGLYTGTMAADMAPLAPARLVPAVRLPDGTVIGESLAIAETLAERHPTAGLWPGDAARRATARFLCAEMASGFGALRTDCPMQLQRCYKGFTPSPAVRDDLARLETLWAHARRTSGSTTPWLFGAYSLTEVFFTPVAARIIGYGLPVSAEAWQYCTALVNDPAMQDWSRAAHAVAYDPEPYALDLPAAPWPGSS